MDKKKILKTEDLLKLSSVIHNNMIPEYDMSNMTIILTVDEDTLKRVNEDIFYTNNNNTMETPVDVDEIVINVNGIHFKYTLLEEDM